MKLEVGMYVRTKKGSIAKVTGISEEKEFKKVKYKDIYTDVKTNPYLFSDRLYELAKEPSFNPIDLIEVGDYVNGSKVIDFMYSKDKKRSVIVDSEIWGFDAEDIKSIVTKEMFSSMEYKVGE